MANVAKDFAQLISQSKSNKTGPYDTQATVKRVEGNTVWVSIPGGIDETPIDKTVNCSAGDKVQVRVSGGRAWITGNASAPPTDDTTAIKARTTANEAQVLAVDAKETADAVEGIAVNANTTAVTAKTIAEGVNEHFWHDSTGAHVTEVTQDEWNDPGDPNYHSGGNTLITTQGMAIRNGMTNLAQFGSTGAVIGQNDDTRLYIDNDSVFSTNARGFSTFEINSLPSGTYNNKAEWFEYNNESPFECVFRWNCTSINNNVQCYDSSFNRVVGLNPQPTLSNNTAIFDATQCAQLQSNSVKYILMGYTAVGAFPYFTFGERGAGTIGKYSTCIGETCVASNNDSYAEGLDTKASGVGAHAEGNGTAASGGYSHAEGYGSEATGTQSHAEGHLSVAGGNISHAEGYETSASGINSHAQNSHTKASSDNQTALGKYNVEDNANTYAVIIGNGTADNARSNALTVDWNGNVEADGDITDGSGNVLADKADSSSLATVATSGSYNDLTNKPSIPSNTSDLNNDSHFIAKGDFVISSHTTTNKTISGGSTMSAETQTFTKSGYYPLAISGWVLNGSNATNLTLVHLYISSQARGSVGITYRIHNAGSSQSTSSNVRVYILWIKEN